MNNAALVLELTLILMQRTQALQLLLQKAHTEGRDVTPEELQQAKVEDDLARAELDAAIERAKAEGR